jgi:hypothetical protein
MFTLSVTNKEHIGAITNYESYSSWMKNTREQGICHTIALPFTLKSVFKAKEVLWKFKYFTMQKHNLQKHPPKETRILLRLITL